ncbi:hypothetical protein C725_1727 [Pacificimonas flava]|uniref:Uncharacterized protein n=1 Tax=Pacificimonas flava TaxID=1234595 RepID=M2T9A4_9SPHN|nr:hypothetical protein C725_1727 [Pacificimonas flava]
MYSERSREAPPARRTGAALHHRGHDNFAATAKKRLPGGMLRCNIVWS